MATSNEHNLVSTLEALQIPHEFARYDSLNETEVIVHLEEWRRRAYVVLSELGDKYRTKDNLTLEEQARLVATTATFDGNGPWVLDTTCLLAQDILASYASPDAGLLELILQDHVKTIFQTNPHPSLNPATGRKLPRSTGGTFAQLDHLEGQSWKGYPGAPNIISWCIRHTEAVAYEKLWYLIIPPTMTLLDDYETSNKLRGVHLVAELLDRVPGDLLRRTGVDGLLFSSLKISMTFLQNPETPSLIRAAVSTSISLIHKTTTRESAARFDQLCSILGDGIIGSIWVYATRNPDALEASLDVLPEIVDALGIGTVRYLKAIIPQLTHPLSLAPEEAFSLKFQLRSARALAVVIQICAPRIHKWKGVILEGVVKCWVSLTDMGADDNEHRQLKAALKDVSRCLSNVCPSVKEVEYKRLLQLDASIFGPLLKPDDNLKTAI